MREIKIFTMLLFFVTAARADFPRQEALLEKLRQNSSIQITDVQVMPAIRTNTADFNLVLLVENASLWSAGSTLRNQVNRASEIFFSQCGISLGPTLVVKVNLSPHAVQVLSDENFDPAGGPPELVIAAGGLTNDITTGILVKDRTKGRDLALAYNALAVTTIKASGRNWDSLLNTFWISDKYIGNSHVPQSAASYLTLAHETTHLIGNIGHIMMPKNLMSMSSEPKSKTGNLNSDQCKSIRTNLGLSPK